MSTADTPTERLRENAVEVTSMLVVGVGLLALFAGFDLFWVVFVVGFAVLVPIVATLYGDEEDQEEWWGDWGWGWGRTRDRNGYEERSRTERLGTPREDQTDDTALETIRRRYARGELTDAQFERKLELLLETETLEDTEDRHRARELLGERER